jgi:hypothetical protein
MSPEEKEKLLALQFERGMDTAEANMERDMFLGKQPEPTLVDAIDKRIENEIFAQFEEDHLGVTRDE